CFFFFFSSRRRHTRSYGDWSSDVCSSDLGSKSSSGLDAIIGGWQLSGLGRWTSALPFSVVDTRGFTNNFLFNDFMVKTGPVQSRSEERRVGKECTSRWLGAYE